MKSHSYRSSCRADGRGMPAFAAESLKATVNGMVCAFCAQGIEAKLSKLPQAQNVYVNLPQKVVAVQIKDGMTLSPEVVREVVKEAGYEVAAIEAVSMTHRADQGRGRLANDGGAVRRAACERTRASQASLPAPVRSFAVHCRRCWSPWARAPCSRPR